jgi:acetate kinase
MVHRRAFASRFAYGLARHHIHVMEDSYESCLATLDAIITRYRAGIGDRSKLTLTREEAVKRIKALGFTEGDALRWLDSKRRRP